jgi:soluble lytic murein transglycosylase-like protein
MIREAARRHRVEPALVKAVIQAESDFVPYARSPKGALGLMQLMPATARMHGVWQILDPRENVEGGVRHLRFLLDRYSGNVRLALAAYNAGTEAVAKHGGVPPYPETTAYLDRVLRFRQMYAREN